MKTSVMNPRLPSGSRPVRRPSGTVWGSIVTLALVGGCTFALPTKDGCENDADCLEGRACGPEGRCEMSGCDPSVELECADKSCAPEWTRCDDEPRCADGSDEFITWSGCFSSETMCRQSLRAFQEVQLDSFLNCASCHVDGRISGAGEDWGPGGDGTAWGWHSALSALAEREDRGQPLSSWSVAKMFVGRDAIHPEIPAAQTALTAWTEFVFAGGEQPHCAMDCASRSGRTAFVETLALGSAFQCATCHVNGSPTATGAAWGASGDASPDGWFKAVRARLETKEALDGNVENSALFRVWASSSHWSLSGNVQTVQDVQARMYRWIDRQWHCPTWAASIQRAEGVPDTLVTGACFGPVSVSLNDNLGDLWLPPRDVAVVVQADGATSAHTDANCTSNAPALVWLNEEAPESAFYVTMPAGETFTEVILSAPTAGPDLVPVMNIQYDFVGVPP